MLRCRGKSYLDLLAQRAGDCATAPDAVVAPADAETVACGPARVCARRASRSCRSAAGRASSAGSKASVVRFDALISLDLGRLDRLLSVDSRSLMAVFEPGIRLPEADAALRRHGLALGHVPQSYEWATIGGCAATRSAGQSSTGHGRFDAQVVGARVRDAGRVAGDARRARHGRRPVAAPARARLRGRVRRHHPRRAARAAAARARVRRLDRRLVHGGRRAAAAARAGRDRARHRAALRRARDAS